MAEQEATVVPLEAASIEPVLIEGAPIEKRGTSSPRTRREGRLRKHADYQRVYQASRKHFSPSMSYFYALRAPAAVTAEGGKEVTSKEVAPKEGALESETAALGLPVLEPGQREHAIRSAAQARLTGLNPVGGARVGLTAGRVLGKAVDRNRIKRRMREAVRKHISLLTSDVDVILHPRKFVLTLEYAKLESEVGRIFSAIQSTLDRQPGASLPGGSVAGSSQPRRSEPRSSQAGRSRPASSQTGRSS